MTLTFSPASGCQTQLIIIIISPLRGMVMIYLRAKVQGQRSVGSEDRVETNGRMDRLSEAIALPPTLMQLVTKL